MRIILTAIFIFALIIFVSTTSFIEETFSGKPQVLQSSDSLFEITIPGNWTLMTDKLAPGSIFEFGSESLEKYAYVSSRAKMGIGITLSDYHKTALKDLEERYIPTRSTAPRLIQINNDFSCYVNDFPAKIDGASCNMWLFSSETTGCFVRMIAWVPDDKATSSEAGLLKIVSSFKDHLLN